jgi:Flp pilus assembly protein TadG
LKKFRKDNGYAIAEFAITIPILISLFAMGIWAISLSLKKFEMENYTNNLVRTLARGEKVSEQFVYATPQGMKVNVINSQDRIRVETTFRARIPIINKEIEIAATAESASEFYESQ